jgi:hypothetical protein
MSSESPSWPNVTLRLTAISGELLHAMRFSGDLVVICQSYRLPV